MLKKPRDFVGNIFAMMIGKQLEDEEIREKVSKWNMDVLIETNFYPILLHFDNGVIVTREVVENPTITISMDFDTIIHMMDEKTTMIREYLRRNIRIQGLFKHPRSVFRMYRFMKTLLGG